ncbi:MAG: hypothetical protein RRY62_05930 [Chryseobacterium sp.]
MLAEQEVIAIAKNYVLERSQNWELELAIAEEYSIQNKSGIIF